MSETNGQHVIPVGRLDKASNGLVLLATEGDIFAKLLRPSVTQFGSAITKEYHVATEKRVSDEHINQMKMGVDIFIRNWSKPKIVVSTLPCEIERLGRKTLKFILREGKNRQIRKMLGSFDHKVVDLTRVRFGPISLTGLREGEIELLSHEELNKLLALCDD